MIKLPPELEVQPVPLEKAYRGVLRGLMTRIKTLYEAIYEEFGDEGLSLIQRVSESYGAEIAEKARGRSEQWDIQDVGLYLVKIFNNMRSEGEVEELNENRFSIAVPECPYPFVNPEICAAHTSMERALVRGLNPDLDYVIEESVPRGDSRCLHVLRWKG